MFFRLRPNFDVLETREDMTASKIHDSANPEPLSKVAEVERKYGDLAPEYAKVRAETAAEAGEPEDAAEWQQVEQKLEAGDDGAAD